jgi:hypothetical protein
MDAGDGVRPGASAAFAFVAHVRARNAAYFTRNRTAVSIESPRRSYVGQVGNLRRVVNPPGRQLHTGRQAEYHSAAGYHPAP